MGSSPARRESAKTARDGGFARRAETPATASLCARTDGSRSEERETGEEKETRGSQPTTYPSAGRGERGGAGRGAHGCGFMRERGGWRKGMKLTRGPRLSATGERGGGRGLAGWADWAKSEGERRVLFIFFQLIFKSIFNLNFEQIFLLQNSHITK